MRAKDSKLKSKPRRLAQARALLRDALGWLRGYPIATAGEVVRWCVVPPVGESAPHVIDVDRGSIRRTVYQRNRLARDFPRVLPELVGDVDAWRADFDDRIEACKRLVHAAAALPTVAELAPATPAARKQIDRLLARAPALENGLRALLWYSRGRERSRRLDIIARRDQQLARVHDHAGDDGVVLAIEILRVDGRRADELLRSVAEPSLAQVVDENAAAELRGLADSFSRSYSADSTDWSPPPAHETLSRCLPRLLVDAYSLPTPARRRLFELFELLFPPDIGERWRHFAERVDKERTAAAAWLAHGVPTGMVLRLSARYNDEFSRYYERLKRVQEQVPPSFPFELVPALGRWCRTDGTGGKLHADVRRALRELPHVHGDGLFRARMFVRWCTMATVRTPAKIQPLIRGLRRHFEGDASSRRAVPWDWVLGRGGTSAAIDGLVEQCLDGDSDECSLADLLRALRLVCENEAISLTAATLQPLPDIAFGCGSPEFAVEAVAKLESESLLERSSDLVRDALVAAAMLADRDAKRFTMLVDRMSKRELSWEDGNVLRSLAAIPSTRALFAGSILDGGVRRVIDLGLELEALGELGAKAPALAPKRKPGPAWWRRYPPELAPVLRELDRATADAPNIAREMLRRDFPVPEELRQEIAALERRAAETTASRAAAMRGRIRNLERKLDEVVVLSPKRLSNHAVKLGRRARREQLAAAFRAVDERLRRALGARVGPECVEWCLREERARRVLPFLLGLKPSTRELALRLLAVRAGEPPWDLRDHPKNRAFVQRMRRRGLDLERWLSDDRIEVEAADGLTVVLGFESDPLEVFQMGAHFATCLSPGDFNFFSTVANAADLNKRVLFARDARGRVVGRCLLALTKAGEMLTFHAYCHDAQLGFDGIAAAFARQLAADVGATLATSGHVESLIAPEWYDDGAEDLAGSHGFLQSGSPFLSSLSEQDVAGFRAMLNRQCRGKPNSIVLQRLLATGEMQERPDLVEEILPWIVADRQLPTMVRAAWILHTAKRSRAAERLVASMELRRQTVRRLAYHELSDLFEVLPLDPTRALRVLRWTRDVRRWADEPWGLRLLCAARAHDALHRPRLALELYELAQRRDQHLEQHCQQPIRRLRAVLGER